KRVEDLQNVSKVKGAPVRALVERPFVAWPLSDFLDAYFRISKRRQFGMTINPIQFSEIESFARTHLYPRDIRFFIRCMEEMDDAHLKWIDTDREHKEEQERKKREKETAAKKAER